MLEKDLEIFKYLKYLHIRRHGAPTEDNFQHFISFLTLETFFDSNAIKGQYVLPTNSKDTIWLISKFSLILIWIWRYCMACLTSSLSVVVAFTFFFCYLFSVCLFFSPVRLSSWRARVAHYSQDESWDLLIKIIKRRNFICIHNF